MSDENNRRYVGEVFIDGKSDRLLQEFLTNLFNSYNGPEKGFNADMLDDWHLEDITQSIDEKTSSKLETITIGHTIFSISALEQFLSATDIIHNEFKNSNNAPWITYLRQAKENTEQGESFVRENSTGLSDEGNYLLNDIILDLYYTLDLSKVNQDIYDSLAESHDILCTEFKALKEDYDTFKVSFDGMTETVRIEDSHGDIVEKTFINAQLINGFRIIPITQSDYNNLPQADKEYWRNIYIIRDSVPDQYVDPIQFSILKDIRLVVNTNTQCLEYYNGVSDDPIELCSLEDLLVGADFNNIINAFVTGESNVIYNVNAIKETIKELILDQNEYDDLPFLTREESHVLASDILSDYGPIYNESNDDAFQTYDITHAYDTVFGDLGNKTIAEEFADVNTRIDESIELMNTKDTETENRVKNYINSNYDTSTVVNTKVGNVSNNVSTLNTKVTNVINSQSNLQSQINNKVAHDYTFKYCTLMNGTVSNNRYGVHITCWNGLGIIVFNNPHVYFNELTEWANVVSDNLHDIIGNFNLNADYYSNTHNAVLGGTRVRITKGLQIQACCEKTEWIRNNNVSLGWGQLVFPIDLNEELPREQ